MVEDRKVSWFLGMDEVFHKAEIPILCFCGSHQILGFSFNRDLKRVKRLKDEPMKKLGPGEDLPRQPVEDPRFFCRFMAAGFFPITRVKADPIFKGLPRTMIMRCSHYCEVKKLPKGFEKIKQCIE